MGALVATFREISEISTQVGAQANAGWPHLIRSIDIVIWVHWETCDLWVRLATQRKSVRMLNLRILVTASSSVWVGI